MNEDTLTSEGRDIAGKIKETVGDVTGSSRLQGEGLVDQLAGKLQKGAGVLRDGFGVEGEPLIDKARRFARERPFATVALAGVLGVAILNTLRGKR